ncbi:MAG: hypothetical protein CVV53_08500, partial [Spirochaetae bacterium HGW-Spirochaetae-9]
CFDVWAAASGTEMTKKQRESAIKPARPQARAERREPALKLFIMEISLFDGLRVNPDDARLSRILSIVQPAAPVNIPPLY